MRLCAGTIGSLTRSAAGAALALFLAGPSASAQPVATAPAALESCQSAAAESAGRSTLFQCFYKASLRTSRAVGHLVSFETRTDANAETAPAFVDAAAATSDVLAGMAARSGGDYALSRITGVVIAVGAAPSAVLSNGVLIIKIVPAESQAGRPSPDQIERAVRTP